MIKLVSNRPAYMSSSKTWRYFKREEYVEHQIGVRSIQTFDKFDVVLGPKELGYWDE